MKIKKFNEELDNELMKSHLDDDAISHYTELKDEIQNGLEFSLYELSANMEEYTQGAEGEIKLSGDINSEFGDYEYVISIKRIG
jgi:hypothetical protein